jgi:hypothetical protein
MQLGFFFRDFISPRKFSKDLVAHEMTVSVSTEQEVIYILKQSSLWMLPLCQVLGYSQPKEVGAVSESLGEDSLGDLSKLSCEVLKGKDKLTFRI